MSLGKYIKDRIKSQGRTIAWVADRMNINERTFAGKLNRDSITGEDLIKISHILGINLEQLKREMLNMKFKVYITAEGFKGNPLFNDEKTIEVYNEEEAKYFAEQLSLSNPNKEVYIFFERGSDGQTGFYNSDGYGFEAVSWSE
jgi:transcriptional regulator with XRE-family HTH domain